MKRVFAIFACMCLSGVPATGQDFFPALYRVTGVMAGDVLNVRAGPGAGFEIVATLAPGATDVEAAGEDPETGWLLVNVRDLSGYAAPQFLERLPDQRGDVLPRPLVCAGAEPFWGLDLLADGSARYVDPETPQAPMNVYWDGPAAARAGGEFGAILAGSDRQVHFVIQRQICTDGMSDFAYGFKIDAIVATDTSTFMMTGCCALRHW